jgi:hypothetical protein
MDNLGAHKTGRVRELIEGRGCCELWFLPAYSPDLLNLIEEAFSKVKGHKGHLRKVAARTREALWWKRWARRSRRSRPGTRRDGSPTAATGTRVNTHEHRCQLPARTVFEKTPSQEGAHVRLKSYSGGGGSFTTHQ